MYTQMIHNTTGIELRSITTLSDSSYARTIEIRTEQGQTIDITLFSNNKEALEIKVDRKETI